MATASPRAQAAANLRAIDLDPYCPAWVELKAICQAVECKPHEELRDRLAYLIDPRYARADEEETRERIEGECK